MHKEEGGEGGEVEDAVPSEERMHARRNIALRRSRV